MKNKIKKIILFMTVLSLCFVEWSSITGKNFTAHARGKAYTYNAQNGTLFAGSGKDSITIQGKPGVSLKNKVFNVYKVLDYEESLDHESRTYYVNPVYKEAIEGIVLKQYKAKGIEAPPTPLSHEVLVDYIQSMTKEPMEKDDSDYRKFIEELRTVLKNSCDFDFAVKVVSTDAENRVKINGLYDGYYIIDEDSDIAGKNTAASLCMVTDSTPDAVVNIKADYPVITKKICEDDPCADISDRDGWNDIADFEIGQDIPYRYVSTIPEITGYEKYYYCWHDKMDSAISFYNDTVKVSISGTDASGQEKTYVLAPKEYVITETNTPNETFNVEVADIKAIVDREFNAGASIKKYGQKVTLEYTGALNNTASEKTGRPGFENSVQLEFSNDPDIDGTGSKGKTPWDTVVCFTYTLKINKVNEHDKPLKGATFLLYNDKECTKPIHIVKKADTYVLNNSDFRYKEDNAYLVSDAQGKISIAGLDGGTYYLKETIPPKGYAVITKPIIIKITPEFTKERDSYVINTSSGDGVLISLKAEGHVERFFRGFFRPDDKHLTTDVEKGEIYMDVLNRTGKHLPRTGTSAGIIIFAAGTLCMVAAFAVKGKNKKR